MLSLYQHKDGVLYVGTSLGLNVLQEFNTNEPAVFHRYSMKQGLPNNTIHGIVVDEYNNVWLSTNLGLSQWLKSEERFINYRVSDGLQNNEFADGSCYYDTASATIYMGGIGGFNYFKANEVKQSTKIPNLMIHRISGEMEKAPYIRSLLITPNNEQAKTLELDYDQNFFDIKLSTLSMINNEKCQYAYRLDDFNKSWNNIDNRHTISFTNIPPGSYKLYLKWSNRDGVWTEKINALNLVIHPIFWKSGWAYLLYSCLFICLLIFVMLFFQKQSSLRRAEFLRNQEEKLHENKLDFFTNIAHELQTPLTLLVGPAEKLMKSTQLSNTDSKLMAMIYRSSTRLSFLIHQLLEFRRAENKHLEVSFSYIDLQELLKQIGELFHDVFDQKKINFHYSMESLLGYFDQDKIEKIVFNLMSNAYKYTPEGGNVDIFLSSSSTGEALINVRNTGSYISEEKRNRIFDNFFILSSSGDQQVDRFRTGIGLAYVKTLVEALRGSIEVKSHGGVNEFIVRLPKGKGTSAQTPNLVKRSAHLEQILDTENPFQDRTESKVEQLDKLTNQESKKTILIVEDELEIHDLIRAILSEQYTLSFAQNGLEALELINTKAPDLIISDVMMPEMDGIALCKAIKEDQKNCTIPIVLLTAKTSVQHRLEGLEVGANSYIPKPFSPDHLEIRVRKLLEEREQIRQYFKEASIASGLSDLPIEDRDKEFIREVFELIESNLSNGQLGNDFLEQHLGMSSSSFYRKVKELTSLSPSDLIRSIRLKQAAKLLLQSKLTVQEICYQSGFNSRSYFYREFQKMYGLSPSEYRKQGQ